MNTQVSSNFGESESIEKINPLIYTTRVCVGSMRADLTSDLNYIRKSTLTRKTMSILSKFCFPKQKFRDLVI